MCSIFIVLLIVRIFLPVVLFPINKRERYFHYVSARFVDLTLSLYRGIRFPLRNHAVIICSVQLLSVNCYLNCKCEKLTRFVAIDLSGFLFTRLRSGVTLKGQVFIINNTIIIKVPANHILYYLVLN